MRKNRPKSIRVPPVRLAIRARIPQGVTGLSPIVSARSSGTARVHARLQDCANHRILSRRALATTRAPSRLPLRVRRLTKRDGCGGGTTSAILRYAMKTHSRISERQSKAALLASTTAVLILVLAGVLFAAELEAPGNLAVPGAPMTLTGSLLTLFGDAPSGGGHMHVHMLVDDKGRATKIEVPDSVIAAAGGRAAINHRRVTVRGQTFSALPSPGSAAASRFEVDAITVDGSAMNSLPAASPLAAEALVSGSQKWVSILCRFADSAGVTPYPKTWFETLMLGGEAPSLDHFWRE